MGLFGGVHLYTAHHCNTTLTATSPVASMELTEEKLGQNQPKLVHGIFDVVVSRPLLESCQTGFVKVVLGTV
jgi:hypothetical protein